MQMLSVIAMLGLAALASAQTTAITGYHWVGETGSLTEKYNWKTNTPYNNSYQALDAEWQKPIKTIVGIAPVEGNPGRMAVGSIPPHETLFVGGKLEFKGDFKIVLGDGAKIELDETANGRQAESTLGMSKSTTDFMCHKNWKGMTAGSLVEVSKPPCAVPQGSNGLVPAHFPVGPTYNVWVSQNYKQLTLKSINFNQQTITTCSDLWAAATNQLYLGVDDGDEDDCNDLVSFNGDTTHCKSLYQYTESSGCFCHSSCASYTEKQADEQESREAQQELIDEIKLAYTTVETNIILGAFTPASLPSSATDLAAVVNDGTARAKLVSNLENTLATRWQLPAANITGVQVKLDGDNLQVSGSATGMAINFMTQVVDGKEAKDVFNFNPISVTPTNTDLSLAAAIFRLVRNSVLELLGSPTIAPPVLKRFPYGQELHFGWTLPHSDQTRLLDSTNKDKFYGALTTALEGFIGMTLVQGLAQTKLVKMVTRRRSVSPMKFAIPINEYSYMAIADVLTGNDDNKHIVQQRLNNVALSFQIQSHSECYDLTTGYDKPCLQALANKVYDDAIKSGSTPAQALFLAEEAYKAVVKCGTYGQDETGKCLVAPDSAYTANIDRDAATVGTSAQNSFTEDKASSASIMPIVIGAVAGLLVVILVVVVVLKRRGRKAKPASNSLDRNVVAFENPMYDDPTVSQPSYEDSGHASHGDGLYDEPAFNEGMGNKSNPVYQSQEGLQGFGGGGYLDVAPESGYLDVAPEADE